MTPQNSPSNHHKMAYIGYLQPRNFFLSSDLWTFQFEAGLRSPKRATLEIQKHTAYGRTGRRHARTTCCLVFWKACRGQLAIRSSGRHRDVIAIPARTVVMSTICGGASYRRRKQIEGSAWPSERASARRAPLRPSKIASLKRDRANLSGTLAIAPDHVRVRISVYRRLPLGGPAEQHGAVRSRP